MQFSRIKTLCWNASLTFGKWLWLCFCTEWACIVDSKASMTVRLDECTIVELLVECAVATDLEGGRACVKRADFDERA